MKRTCIYEHCGTVERLNDEGVCARCAEILTKVTGRIESGRLPKMPSAQLQPWEKVRTVAIRAQAGGMACAACDAPINVEHWAYPDFPGPRRYEIWQKEANVA
jgi:hypothetical protein